MKVWLVVGWVCRIAYYEDTPLGIWTSETKADEQIERVKASQRWGGADKEEVELDTELVEIV